MNDTRSLVDEGKWSWGDESVRWELLSAASTPETDKCTAAFCVAITKENKILLVREKRGWGMMGGHIEKGESVMDALMRECLEEAGFGVNDPVHFAYRSITATKPVAHPTPGRRYPFPTSYISYYYSVNDARLIRHTEQDVFEVRAFTIDEIQDLNIADFSTIKLGWDDYLRRASQV